MSLSPRKRRCRTQSLESLRPEGARLVRKQVVIFRDDELHTKYVDCVELGPVCDLRLQARGGDEVRVHSEVVASISGELV